MAESLDPTTSKGNYKTLEEDPEYLLQLINKYVRVYVLKNISFNGFIHSIDPITYSIILSVPQENTFQTTLIPGHAIVDVIELPAKTQAPSRRISMCEQQDDEKSRRNKLMSWFKKNLLPVSMEADNIIVGTAKVLPPYNVLDIYAENPIVAVRIRKIMSMMPENFECTSTS